MSRRRADMTALVDQADAAGRDAAGAMHALAGRLATQVHKVALGPVVRRGLEPLYGGMLGRALAGEPTRCDHLSFAAPAVAFWLPYVPDRLRCALCARLAVDRISGTVEDRRCDGCGEVVPTIGPCTVQLPPLVLDAPPLPASSLPPILVMFGLCRRCQRKDGLPGDGPGPGTVAARSWLPD